MNAYEVLTAIHGLVRAGELSAHERRQPIAVGEIVALPDTLVGSLIAAMAIKPSDEEPTVELDWNEPAKEPERDPAAGLIDPTDWEAVRKAVHEFGALLFKQDDLAGLAAAANELGALVVQAGADLSELAARLSNAELVKELVGRLESGRLPRWELPEQLQPKPADAGDAVPAKGKNKGKPVPTPEMLDGGAA